MVHFLFFPSVAQSVRVISAAVLSVFQVDGGNSSLGLPLTADPSPSQTNWPDPLASIILMLQGATQQNLTLTRAATRFWHI